MDHRDVLHLLLPPGLNLDDTGVHAQELTIEGGALDAALGRAAVLLAETTPAGAAETITSWERVYGLVPGAADSLQQRRERIIAWMDSRGGQSLLYFQTLAAQLGLTITITEPEPHVWTITIAGTPLYDFRSGASCCGELLTDWPTLTAYEGLFQELKPAHTRLIIGYA